jgi:uncharacterized protein
MSVRFVIDPLDFVRNAGIHHGRIPVLELVRLHDLLFDKEGEVTYQISGYFDKNNKPSLHLEIKGEMHLSCQRCLDKLTHVIDLRNDILLARNEVELNQNDDEDAIDAILASSDLDVMDLIEEEIILGLAISSRHPEGECAAHQHDSTSNLTDKQPAHPFAVLASLKKH